MTKYKKNLTDEDIQVLKNTMQKYDDIKSPMKIMAQSIVTEQEKAILRLMYFRFTDYEQQKQRADELEKRWSTLWQKLKYEYDIANNSTELRCFGMSLDIMHELQEDDNA